tara:strand:- start:626 stop:772 length:147 start_codon:yes stop_codon:yes gene_type:complete
MLKIFKDVLHYLNGRLINTDDDEEKTDTKKNGSGWFAVDHDEEEKNYK